MNVFSKAGLVLLAVCSAVLVRADWGIWDAGIFLNVNGSGLAYSNATNFNGAALGTFLSVSNHSLILLGGEIKTYKNGGSDVTGGTMYYSVYPADESPAAFLPISLGFFSNLPAPGDQVWQRATSNINVLASLTRPGSYRLSVYYSASGTNPNTNKYYSNVENNYVATFNFNTPELTVNGVSANYTTTKFFVDELAADSFPLDIVFKPNATNLAKVEVFSNVNRRDYASRLWTNAQGTVVQEGLLPPEGYFITTNETERYYRAYAMSNTAPNEYRLALQAQKTGAYRLTARYQLNGSTNWLYFTDTPMGRRDHAVVVSPKLARDMRVYEINTLNVDATGPAFAQRSTFNSLLSSARWNLNYLTNMGINTLWFQPIHPNGIDGREPSGGWSNTNTPPYDPGSPYAVKNFFEVMEQMSDLNTRAASMTAFSNFYEAARARHVHIMLDAPFNHTAYDVELGQPGVELMSAAGVNTAGWSATNEIRNREARFFSRNDGGFAYSGPASSAANIAAAPDRNDFGKWNDAKDVFFGRYATLVTGYPEASASQSKVKDESDWMNWDDLRGTNNTAGAVTRAVWQYFARYVPYWLEKTGLPAGQPLAVQATSGFSGLRADFGQGMPPQFWEYAINIARAHKWNFVFMTESLDGGEVTYRSNRHFDILNENIVFPWQTAANTTAHRAIFENRRNAYGQGLVLLNNTSHDEAGYADPWQAFIRYAVGSTIDGAPMIMYGQEIGTSKGEALNGSIWGFDYFELNFGKWIPHFKQYNSMQPQWNAWSNNTFGVKNLIPAYAGAGLARTASPALKSSNRWFLNPVNSNDPDERIFAVAKYEAAGASPAVSDVMLGFVNLDRTNSAINTFGITSQLAGLMGIKSNRQYNVRNTAAFTGPANEFPERKQAWLWSPGKTGMQIVTQGVYVALNPVPSTDAAWSNAPFEAQYLKVYDVTAPPAITGTPAHVAGLSYVVGNQATYSWGAAIDPEGLVPVYRVVINNNGVITTSTTVQTSITYTGSHGSVVSIRVAVENPHASWSVSPTSSASTAVSMLDPAGDEDGDRVPNGSEWLAGTDVFNVSSFFEMQSFDRGTGTAFRIIRIPTEPGRKYTIYFADGTISNGMNWLAFASSANGIGTWLETNTTSSMRYFIDDEGIDTTLGPPATGSRYYRFNVEVP